MKYFYITGTSKGLGKALAIKLLEDSNNFVYGFARTKTIIHQNYGHYFLDFSNLEDVDAFRFDRTDYTGVEEVVLINNAATITEIVHYDKKTTNEIINDFHVNLISPAILTRRFMYAYRKFIGKRMVINISSGAGKQPISALNTYCASKAAIDMLSKVIAKEEKEKSERNPFHIFSIDPGIMDTKMMAHIREANPNEFSSHENFMKYKTDNRLSKPEDIARKIVEVLKNPQKFPEVLIDLRNIE